MATRLDDYPVAADSTWLAVGLRHVPSSPRSKSIRCHARDHLTSQEGVSRIATHEMGSMRCESGGWRHCLSLIEAVDLNRGVTSPKAATNGTSQASEGSGRRSLVTSPRRFYPGPSSAAGIGTCRLMPADGLRT